MESLYTLKNKHPSPEVNPATQKGCDIFCVSIRGLYTGFMLGNAVCNFFG